MQDFFADKQDLLAEVFAKYPPDRKRSALMPLLRIVQNAETHISAARLEEIARLIGSTPTEVKSVMSFYSAYHESPTGLYHLQVCMTLSCALAGSDAMWDYLQEKLEIGPGEVTQDGLFSMQRVECLGSCATGPVMQVSDSCYFERLSKARLDALLEELKRRADGSVPPPDVPIPAFMRIEGERIGQELANGEVVYHQGTSSTQGQTSQTPQGGES